MFAMGIVSGLLTALLFSISYICSAGFMNRYRSPLRLLVDSQILHHFFYYCHEQSNDWEWLFSFHSTSKIKDLQQIAVAGEFSPPKT